MKVVINLPKSATAYASMLLSDSMEQETIDNAIKQCEESPIEIDMNEVAKTTGQDNSDLQAFNMALAIIAIGKIISDQKKEKESAETEK